MYTILLVLSILTSDGNFHLHLERHDTKKSCQEAVLKYAKPLEASPQVVKYAVDCFPIQDKSV